MSAYKSYNEHKYNNNLYRGNTGLIEVKDDRQYYLIRNYICIDSRDRDRVSYPNVNRYQVLFNPSNNIITSTSKDANGVDITTRTMIPQKNAYIPREFKNVVSIELIRFACGSTTNGNASNNIQNEQYLYLQMDEVDQVFHSTNDMCRRTFAQIPTNGVSGNFMRWEGGEGGRNIYTKTFDPPLASLKRLTINLKKIDGSYFNFGTDTADGNAVNEYIQNNMIICIITKDEANQNLNVHNV